VSGIEILPQSKIPAPEFLNSLDCFTYRTDPSMTESWGRVVAEAMASGLPVVVHANGGYAQLIRHGENGFLFHRDDEAIQHIRNLANSSSLRASVRKAARETVVDLLSDRAYRQYIDFYLR
jgi:glycosyltransferase involved in cell wall biosynthesis